jgi:large subunit ribosomal protein L15
MRPGFEGGQMPLIRRIPKRGFRTAAYRKEIVPVNVERLNVFEDGSRVDTAAFVEQGLVRKRVDGVKVLGKGELKKKLDVVVAAFSESARKKIEVLGGTAKLESAAKKGEE